MANITGYMEIANGTADSNRCYASVVSNNFSVIETAINSNALNSQNYSSSAVYGSHIANSQLQSYHLAQSQIPGAALSNSAIRETNMNWTSASAGARLIRVGGVASNLPAAGLYMGRYMIVAATYGYDTCMSATDAPIINTVTFNWTAQDYGALCPFSAAPWILAEPVVEFPATATTDAQIFGTERAGPSRVLVKGISPDSCKLEFVYANSNTNSYDVNIYFGAIGARSG